MKRKWPELKCLKKHPMVWIGQMYWWCPGCKGVLVETSKPYTFRKCGW